MSSSLCVLSQEIRLNNPEAPVCLCTKTASCQQSALPLSLHGGQKRQVTIITIIIIIFIILKYGLLMGLCETKSNLITKLINLLEAESRNGITHWFYLLHSRCFYKYLQMSFTNTNSCGFLSTEANWICISYVYSFITDSNWRPYVGELFFLTSAYEINFWVGGGEQ